MRELLNPEFLQSVCDIFRNWAEEDENEFRSDQAERREKMIDEYILIELDEWFNNEGLNAHYSVYDAAEKFLIEVIEARDEAVYLGLERIRINTLETTWIELQTWFGKEVNFLYTRQKPLADRERKMEQFRALGGQERAKGYRKKIENWKLLASEIWERNPEHSLRSVASIIENKTGDSSETIRKHIKKT